MLEKIAMLLAITFCLACVYGSMQDKLARFSTLGPDCYADGTIVRTRLASASVGVRRVEDNAPCQAASPARDKYADRRDGAADAKAEIVLETDASGGSRFFKVIRAE